MVQFLSTGDHGHTVHPRRWLLSPGGRRESRAQRKSRDPRRQSHRRHASQTRSRRMRRTIPCAARGVHAVEASNYPHSLRQSRTRPGAAGPRWSSGFGRGAWRLEWHVAAEQGTRGEALGSSSISSAEAHGEEGTQSSEVLDERGKWRVRATVGSREEPRALTERVCVGGDRASGHAHAGGKRPQQNGAHARRRPTG